MRTDEDTVALVRRLAIHYPDAVIAGILNRQERRTAYGHRFTAHLVSSLRRNWDIPRFEPPAVAPQGELMNIKQIAAALDVATSTVHRWLNQGIIAGEQLTPGAPWRIRLTDDLRRNNESEQMMGFHTMLDEHLEVPFKSEVLGVEVRVEKVDLTDDDQIVVVCTRGKSRQSIPILNLPLPSPPPKGAEWIDAYRRWACGK